MMSARSRSGVIGIVAALLLVLPSTGVVAAAADEQRTDVCLEIRASSLPDDAWVQIMDAADQAVADRPDLFPFPAVGITLSEQTERLDFVAEAAGAADAIMGSDCITSGADWTVRVGRAFLDTGADRMLEQAPTTPGIESSVDVEWYPEQNRVTTTLVFAGPLDIPNGTCWIDDTLSVDDASASAVSNVEHGVKTSIFAEGACGRFFDHLDKGGAGEQAITLLPTSLDLGDSSTLIFAVDEVAVHDDAIVISGSVEVALP